MKNIWKDNNLTNEWFYTNTDQLLRTFHIYVKGDSLVLLPLWTFILITGFFSWKFMLLEIGFFLFLRGLGEMTYWLLQQFGKKTYRPETKYNKLSNDAIYILYQLSGLRNAFFGLVLIAFVLIYLY